MTRSPVLTLFALLCACRGPVGTVPGVQSSAPGTARTSISLNRTLSGRYRAIAPSCVGQQYMLALTGPSPSVSTAGGLPLRPGHVVEFRNYQPEIPANVTALDAPAPMFSPNLVKPYNLVREGDDTYSFWRYELPAPGVYEFFDTNMGDPGRKIVDSYYGTVSYVGESDAPRGVICVDTPGCEVSARCATQAAPAGVSCCPCVGVCCGSDQGCALDKTCLRGRCVDKETGT